MKSGRLTIILSVLVLVGLTGLTGCGGYGPPKLADLQANDAALRIRAIKWVAETNRTDAVGLLVDRLEDQDASVRFYAAMALRRITGQEHGYDYRADEAGRSAAVQRWRQAVSGKN